MPETLATNADAVPSGFQENGAVVCRNGSEKSVATAPGLPARNRGGAPVGNRNRIGPGTHSFTLGRYPKGATWIARQGHWLRRELRRSVTERDGSTSTYTEAVIASACVHEGRRLLLARWLRIEGDGLPVLDRANLLDRIGKASDQRDACLRLLKLDLPRADADPWAASGIDAPKDAVALFDRRDDAEAVRPAAKSAAGLSGGLATTVSTTDPEVTT